MAKQLAQSRPEISQTSSKLSNVSKVTKLHYFLLPSLPSHKGELPNDTNVILPSGDSLTYCDEGFSSENVKSDEGNRKQKAQSFLYWIIFKSLTKVVNFNTFKVFILKNRLK